MDLLVSTVSFIFISFVVYSLMDKEGASDLIKSRLEKYSTKKVKQENQKYLTYKQFFLNLLKPHAEKIVKSKENKKTLKQLLLEAGLSATDEDVTRLVVRRLVSSVFGAIIGGMLFLIFDKDMNSIIMALLFPYTCYVLPTFKLKKTIKMRGNEITYKLPDVLDLLTVCVEAGLGLDASLSRVAEEYSRTSPVLAGELSRTSNDIAAGMSRQEAFRNLSSRNNSDDLRTLTALLIQTDKLGTSIGQALRVYSDTVRTRRRQRVEELSQQASVKMIIPLVLFILPAMFIIILGPAAISLMDNFNSMK